MKQTIFTHYVLSEIASDSVKYRGFSHLHLKHSRRSNKKLIQLNFFKNSIIFLFNYSVLQQTEKTFQLKVRKERKNITVGVKAYNERRERSTKKQIKSKLTFKTKLCYPRHLHSFYTSRKKYITQREMGEEDKNYSDGKNCVHTFYLAHIFNALLYFNEWKVLF